MVNPPVLIYPDFTKCFVLETDASTVGLGAVLAQKDKNGVNRPIGYGSRMLKDAEKNYSATELEALGVVWACEQFRPYLYGRQFVIECDHNPLVLCNYLKTQKINTTTYHPQCNGLTARFNATLCQILSMYIKHNQTDWYEYLKTATFAYNTSVQETTRMSPFEILNGREPRLPSDLENIRSNNDSFTYEFKNKWEKARARIE